MSASIIEPPPRPWSGSRIGLTIVLFASAAVAVAPAQGQIFQAESFTQQFGLVGPQAGGTGLVMYGMKAGDWLRYANVDLNGATGLDVAYSSMNPGAIIEVRLDSPTGPRIGSFTTAQTGTWQSFAIQSLSVQPIASARDVYLVGGGANPKGLWLASFDYLALPGAMPTPTPESAVITMTPVTTLAPSTAAPLPPASTAPVSATPAPTPALDSSAAEIVSRGSQGELITTGAGRGTRRHELSAQFFANYNLKYWEDRRFGFTLSDYSTASSPRGRIEVVLDMHGRHYQNEPANPFSPQNAPNLRAFKKYGDETQYYLNLVMQPHDSSSSATATRWFAAITAWNGGGGFRPLQVGDVVELEFSIKWQSLVDAGDNSNYYSNTFRYRVGRGGFEPFNRDDALGFLGPAEPGWLGGMTTIPHLRAGDRDLSFMQLALNAQDAHVGDFLRGRRLFHTDFMTGDHGGDRKGNSEPASRQPGFPEKGGLIGPNDKHLQMRCADCHLANGSGVLPDSGIAGTLVFRLPDGHPFGSHLQPQEAVARVSGRVAVVRAGATLSKPEFAFDSSLVASDTFSARMAPRLVGMGLLDAIALRDIEANADENDLDADGISGRVSKVQVSGTVMTGRFGWKAEQPTLRHQVAGALLHDMGVRSSLFPSGDNSSAVGAEITDTELDEIATYVRLLAVPAQRHPDPASLPGLAIFRQIGCARCHVESFTTTSLESHAELRRQVIHPYSDLLLHDLGPDLADHRGDREWRTAPLWGLGLADWVAHGSDDGRYQLLHDGRARTLDEAVRWHGGEAQGSANAYANLMTASQRQALLDFLESL